MTDQMLDQSKETQATESYVEQLVGDGKQYSDIEKLAKSRIDANEHIQRLESELATFRSKEEENKKKEDHLETIVGLLKTKDEPQVVVKEEEPKVDPVITEPIKEERNMSLDMESLRKREAERMLLDRYGNTETAGLKMREYINNDPAREEVVMTLLRTDPNALMSILPTVEPVKETNPTGSTALTGPPPSQLPTTATEAMRLFAEDNATYNSPAYQSKLEAAIIAAEQAGIDFDKT